MSGEQAGAHTGNGHPPPIDIESLPLVHIELITLGTIDGETPARKGAALMKLVRWLKIKDFQLEAVLELLQAHPEGIAKGYGGGRLETQLVKIWDKIRDLKRPASWVDQLHGADRGKPTNDVENTAQALRLAPEAQNLHAYDELQRRPIHRGDPAMPQPVQDVDVIRIQEFLQRAGMRKVSKETVADAIEIVARQHSFHPVRDYLDKLVWDGTERLDWWLEAYLGVARINGDEKPLGQDYVDAIGRMFLISAVARIYQPGCQVDYVLVLEGNQGSLKSSAVSALASPWFSDHLPDLHRNEKDVSQHLNGKWIIEIPELSALVKADSTAIKSFLTRRVERYRRSYGRLDVDEPRQCVFVGTTNEATYLRDGTGGRRFWPVLCGRISLDTLIRDRDQLWAEAVHRYRAGEQWWPDADFERETFVPQQQARFDQDAWVEPIQHHLERLLSRHKDEQHTTIVMVARDALGLHLDRLDRTQQRRIAAILRSLQWREGKRTMTARLWVPA